MRRLFWGRQSARHRPQRGFGRERTACLRERRRAWRAGVGVGGVATCLCRIRCSQLANLAEIMRIYQTRAHVFSPFLEISSICGVWRGLMRRRAAAVESLPACLGGDVEHGKAHTAAFQAARIRRKMLNLQAAEAVLSRAVPLFVSQTDVANDANLPNSQERFS